jgi:FkbM family methyltransferase
MIAFLDKLKLQLRANKYKNKDDKGGIAYILQNIKNGETVLDIGCHKAGYLFFMQQRVGNNGKVVAFEPQSLLYNYIKKIITVCKWQNVKVEHLALSDNKGVVTLFIPTNTKSKASSPGATIVHQSNTDNIDLTEQVDTNTLDTYCLENNLQPNLLKIDVEGNELRVLMGGIEAIKKLKPKILIECEARHVGKEQVNETFNYLLQLGYKGYFINDIHKEALEKFDFEKHQNTNDMKHYCNNFVFE